MSGARARWLAIPLLVGLAGCGVPTQAQPSTVDPSAVPYGLTSPSVSRDTGGQASIVVDGQEPRVHWVADDALEAAAPDRLLADDPAGQLRELLGQLTTGPSQSRREQGVSSALSPGTRLGVNGVRGGVASVEVETAGEDPAADRVPLAVGQIVLTATSVTGVRAVSLVQGGRPLEVPLVGGALTSEPLEGADYRQLLRPSTVGPTPRTTR